MPDIEWWDCDRCGEHTLTEVGSGVVCLSCGYTFVYPCFESLPSEASTERLSEERERFYKWLQEQTEQPRMTDAEFLRLLSELEGR